MNKLYLVIGIVVILAVVSLPAAAISKADLIASYIVKPHQGTYDYADDIPSCGNCTPQPWSKGIVTPTPTDDFPISMPASLPTSQMPSWLPEGWIPPTPFLTPKKNAYDSGLADPTVSDYPDDTPLNCSGHTPLPNVSQVFRTPTPTPTPTVFGDWTPRVISDEERKEIWDRFYRAFGW